jgi:hypothetical protein
VNRYKTSDIRQIDSRIHFLKSKLADEEHKYATLTFAATAYANDLRNKNAMIASLQDMNSEMKLNVAAANLKMRSAEDEIRVLHFSNGEQDHFDC